MSEPARTPLKSAEIRRRALALMKQCWLTLLIAAVLACIPGWIADYAADYSEIAAVRAEQAVFAEFEVEYPRPDDPAALEQWELDRIVHAYFSSADITAARLRRQWKLIGYTIELVGSLFSAILLVGLYHGLLTQLSGGTPCTPRSLLAGWKNWKSAVWLQLRVNACIFGWGLLFFFPAIILMNTGALGELVGLALLIVVCLWAGLRYALVLPHMAEALDSPLSTSECLEQGVQAMRYLTVWGLIRVMWPFFLIGLLAAALTTATGWFSWLTLPAAIFTVAADISVNVARCACYTFLCDEIHRHRLALAQEESAN